MGDPFPFEDDLGIAIDDWHRNDPVGCWLGRALWAGIIVGGFVLGAGIVLGLEHVVGRRRTVEPWKRSSDSSERPLLLLGQDW